MVKSIITGLEVITFPILTAVRVYIIKVVGYRIISFLDKKEIILVYKSNYS